MINYYLHVTEFHSWDFLSRGFFPTFFKILDTRVSTNQNVKFANIQSLNIGWFSDEKLSYLSGFLN